MRECCGLEEEQGLCLGSKKMEDKASCSLTPLVPIIPAEGLHNPLHEDTLTVDKESLPNQALVRLLRAVFSTRL